MSVLMFKDYFVNLTLQIITMIFMCTVRKMFLNFLRVIYEQVIVYRQCIQTLQ
jgi:hypothetical protein